MVYPAHSFAVVPGEGRRATGAHYTPAEFARDIVEKTLTPVIYEGPAEGWPEDEWKLRSSAELLDLKVCDPAMGSAAFLVATCRYLSKKLITAWKAEEDAGKEISVDGQALDSGSGTELMSKELDDRLLVAHRLIAERCIFGVDMNPMAVELAKLSIWLVTLQKGRPFGFLDHNLQSGDALLGLHCLDQLTKISMHPKAEDQSLIFGQNIKDAVEEALVVRKQLREVTIRDVHDVEKMAELNAEAKSKLVPVELLADAMIGEALVCGGKENKLKAALEVLSTRADGILRLNEETVEQIKTQTIINLSIDQAPGKEPRKPFHWALEFPEVLENGGFNAFVGNPPYGGKNTISGASGASYLKYISKILHIEAHGNADLVAHFYRRAFTLLKDEGCFGLIATNTIAQGDTRQTGLSWICNNGGTIYLADKRVKWPGKAAVVVSIVYVSKGDFRGELILGGEDAPQITAFLFHGGGHENPASLVANSGKSFVGSYVLGMGFTFDDTDKKGAATPIAEMHRLIEKDPRNSERIFPYIGGQEINVNPTHSHHRYVINFGEMCESEAQQWPDLINILKSKVKPERDKLGNNPDARRRKERWWLWGRYTPALFRAISGMDRVLVCTGGSGASKYLSFVRLPLAMVYDQTLCVFALSSWSAITCLQSRLHEVWARFFGGTMKDDPRYNSSRCFDTFPFPENWQTDSTLEAAGKTYYEFRAELMVRNDEGLTKTYNRFHNPDEDDAKTLKLRELHTAMDRAVLNAYGWDDISTDCEFIADYEVKEGKKIPYRYRWPEEVHDDVLARLLELHQKRYEEEVAQGLHDKKKPKAKAEKPSEGQTELF